MDEQDGLVMQSEEAYEKRAVIGPPPPNKEVNWQRLSHDELIEIVHGLRLYTANLFIAYKEIRNQLEDVTSVKIAFQQRAVEFEKKISTLETDIKELTDLLSSGD